VLCDFFRFTLRRDENELAVLHFLCNVNETLDSQLPDLRVKEDIKLIENSERRFECLSESKKQAHRRVASLSTTVNEKWDQYKGLRTVNLYNQSPEAADHTNLSALTSFVAP